MTKPIEEIRRKVEVTEPSDDALIDLWWKTSGDDWAVPDWLMVKFGRAVRALGGEQQ